MRFLLLAVAALFVAAPAAGQDVWYENDRPAAPDPARASRDGFGVMLMMTGDADGFMRAWAGPTPPTLPITNQAERNQFVHGMLIFRGCRAGADGKCNVTAEFVILKPDGSPYGDTLRGPIWNDVPAPGSNLQLGLSNPGIRIEPHDPQGTYLIRAIVTDHVAGITLDVEQRLTVDTPAVGEVA